MPEDKLPEVIVSKTETTPPTLNDEPTAARIQSAFSEALRRRARAAEPREGMGGEDFAYYGAPEHGVKAVFFFVGGTPEAELADVAAHHSPLFKIAPEPASRRASRRWSSAR